MYRPSLLNVISAALITAERGVSPARIITLPSQLHFDENSRDTAHFVGKRTPSFQLPAHEIVAAEHEYRLVHATTTRKDPLKADQ